MGTSLPIGARGLELGNSYFLCSVLEGNFQRHIQHQIFWGIIHADDVAHHPWSLFKLDHGDGVRSVFLEAWNGPMVDHVAPKDRLPGGFEPGDIVRQTLRAMEPRIKEDVLTDVATLNPQLVLLTLVPEELGLRRGNRHGFAVPLLTQGLTMS